MTERQGIVLGITGKAGAGKDTIANYLVSNYNFTHFKFADKLYKMAELFGMEGKKDRTLLIKIAKAMREIDEDIFIDEIRKFKRDEIYTDLVISDMRQYNEWEFVKRYAWGYVIKVTCPLKMRIDRIEKRDNYTFTEQQENELVLTPTEREVETLKADLTVKNDKTIDDLYDEIDKFMLKTFNLKPKRELPKVRICSYTDACAEKDLNDLLNKPYFPDTDFKFPIMPRINNCVIVPDEKEQLTNWFEEIQKEVDKQREESEKYKNTFAD